MEEKQIKPTPPTLREIITDWAIGSFFGTYGAYYWMGTDGARADLIAAFGVERFALLKAGILLASMFFLILGGYRLFKIINNFRSYIRIGNDDNVKKK